MKLYSEDLINQIKRHELLPCQCDVCGKVFKKKKKNILDAQQRNVENIDICSPQCKGSYQKKGEIVSCKVCGKKIYKKQADIKKSKSKYSFCSKSCSVTYNNKIGVPYGSRRSKLEKWLNERLDIIYPNIEIDYNKKDAINGELDIYIPSLKLAFELNGIFHYEAIFGDDKLSKIQNNDNRKFQACLEKGIELCVIDVSSQKYFKEKTSQKYLDIITNIITEKIRRV